MKGVESRHEGGYVKKVAEENGLPVYLRVDDFLPEQNHRGSGSNFHSTHQPKPQYRCNDHDGRGIPTSQDTCYDTTEYEGGSRMEGYFCGG